MKPQKKPSENRRPVRSKDFFSDLARKVTYISGRTTSFITAFLLIVVWLITGPYFGFSDTWQLVVNTATTIITFLMVFIIQNTQNRETEAIEIKLDELILYHKGAHRALMDAEDLTQEELEEIRKTYEQKAQVARKLIEKRKKRSKTK